MRRMATVGAAALVGMVGWLGVRRLLGRTIPAPATDGAGDERIAGAARALLRRSLGSKAEDVAVTVRSGWVTVRGDVENLDEIRRLEAAIQGVPGVVGVHNLLRLDVRRRSPGEASPWRMWVS